MPYMGTATTPGAYVGAGGGGFSFGSLFSNPLVLQMMASTGASLDPEGPAGAIGRTTNQWIRSQSQMKMMQKLLGGGAKITMDKDKTNITGDSSLLDNLSMDQGAQDAVDIDDPEGFRNYINRVQSRRARPEPVGRVNPFVSSQPDASLADLAGLRGEDINQAMQLMLGQRNIDRKTVADLYDALYKMGIIDVQGRQAGTQRLIAERKQDEIDRKLRERTPYKIAGQTVHLTPKEFAAANKNTAQYRNYLNTLDPNESPTGSGFEKYQETMSALSGGLDLEGKIEEREAFADVRSKKFFTDPKEFAREIDRYINSEEVQNRLFALEPGEREQALNTEKSSAIASRITSAGGEIVDRKKEGSIRIWVVKWPDGTTSEVRHAF